MLKKTLSLGLLVSVSIIFASGSSIRSNRPEYEELSSVRTIEARVGSFQLYGHPEELAQPRRYSKEPKQQDSVVDVKWADSTRNIKWIVETSDLSNLPPMVDGFKALNNTAYTISA